MRINILFYLLILIYPINICCQIEFNVKLYNPDEVLNEENITQLFPIERELIQAEILANYGYIFEDSLLQRYFLKQIWYKPLTKEFPKLTPIDSINYSLLEKFNKKNRRDIWENIKRFKPTLDDVVKSYFSYCFENSNYRSIAKRKFKLKPFNYCFRQVYYVPRLELPVGVWDFERFFAEEDFDLNEFVFFKAANDVRGILFRGFFSKNGKLLQLDEVGSQPGLDLGKLISENYLDENGRIFVHYNLMCNDGAFSKAARFLKFGENKIEKEILFLEDEDYLYFQITTKDYFIETGLRKRK